MARVLILKEIKDLIRDPRIWIPIAIGALIMPVMGSVINFAMRAQITETLVKPLNVGVWIFESNPTAEEFVRLLNVTGKYFNLTFERVVEERVDFKRLDALLLINGSSVSSLLMEGGKLRAFLITPTAGSLMASPQAIAGRIAPIIDQASTLAYAAVKNIDPRDVSSIKSPTLFSWIPYVPERRAAVLAERGGPLQLTMMGSFLIVIMLSIMALSVIQYAAISTSIENEERTMEVLLTLPIKRFWVSISKVIASFVLGIIGLIATFIGFYVYLELLKSALVEIPAAAPAGVTTLIGNKEALEWIIREVLGRITIYSSMAEAFTPSPTSFAYMMGFAALSLFFFASIGVLIGGLSSDVRMGLTISGNVGFPIMLLSMLFMYMEPDKLPIPVEALLSNPLTALPTAASLSILDKLPPLTPLYFIISASIAFCTIAAVSRALNLETLDRLKKFLKFKRRFMK